MQCNKASKSKMKACLVQCEEGDKSKKDLKKEVKAGECKEMAKLAAAHALKENRESEALKNVKLELK